MTDWWALLEAAHGFTWGTASMLIVWWWTRLRRRWVLAALLSFVAFFLFESVVRGLMLDMVLLPFFSDRVTVTAGGLVPGLLGCLGGSGLGSLLLGRASRVQT